MTLVRRVAQLLACLVAGFFCTVVLAAETVKVSIVVTVPGDTPRAAELHLAGNLNEVGAWKPEGITLAPRGDNTYGIDLVLPKGQTLEYKINRGSWATVEKGSGGDELENRTLALDADKVEKINVARWADGGAMAGATTAPTTRASTATGDIRYHDHFASKVLGNERRLIVWLPPDYSKNTSQRYAVLYMHDGQNLFDAATSYAGEWRADETAAKLIGEGKISPIILVGIANAGAARVDEYTPTRDAQRDAGGKGEIYARFLIDEVKPFIDRTYRTLPDRDHTGVSGSSLGGLISLYLGYRHGDVFGRIGVISPSLFWDNHALLAAVQTDTGWTKGKKIWLDMGTAEEALAEDAQTHVTDARVLAAALQRAGLKSGKDFEYAEIKDAKHNETAWAARFDRVLTFLFGTER